jgi:hypothetical protein
VAVDLVAQAASPAANTFADEDTMTAYCDGRLGGAVWTADPSQFAALVEASRDLSTLSWRGLRASATQALAWPRAWVSDPDHPTGRFYGATEIPRRVVDATCELALQYLALGGDPARPDPLANVVRKKVDVLETEYAAPAVRARGIARFPRVLAMVQPLLAGGGAAGVELART